MQNCLLGERGGRAPTLRVRECISYAIPFSKDFSWRLGEKNLSTGNNLVIVEIFSFSPDK